MKKLFSNKYRSRTISFLGVIIAYAVLQTMAATHSINAMLISLFVPVCSYIIAAIGLNLNVGVSGELNLGQAGFMSIGAFSGIILVGVIKNSVTSPVLQLIIAVIFGALVAALFGFLIGIPVLKLQGDYLAIVTLAFGQIIMGILNNLYVGYDTDGLHFSFINNTLKLKDGGKLLLSGPMGATGVTRISTFTMGTIMVILALIIVYNLMYSKSGRAIMAARDNRIAAESVGINISRTKMLAFVVSASLAGAAGALYGLNYASVAASKFDFNTSILILVYVVLGGLGNMNGTLVATTLLVVLPEMLRFLSSYRMLIYAVVLIVMMIVTNNEKVKTWLEGRKRKKSVSEKGVENNG